MLSNGDLLSHLLTNVFALPGETWTRKLCLVSHAWCSPRPPTSSDRNEILRGAGLQEIVMRFKFHQNRLSGFGAVENGILFFRTDFTKPINMAKSTRKGKFRPPTFEPPNNLVKTTHRAKSHFDPTTWVVSANTQHDWQDTISGFTFPQVVQRH